LIMDLRIKYRPINAGEEKIKEQVFKNARAGLRPGSIWVFDVWNPTTHDLLLTIPRTCAYSVELMRKPRGKRTHYVDN
jgi:hypothetical protein